MNKHTRTCISCRFTKSVRPLGMKNLRRYCLITKKEIPWPALDCPHFVGVDDIPFSDECAIDRPDMDDSLL